MAAHKQALLHDRAAQVHVAVTKPRLLVDVLLVQLEGRSLGMIEHREGVSENLDLAGHHVGIHGAFGALAHATLHLQDELAPHLLGGCKGLLGIGVENDLYQARAVAQIDEDDAAVIAPPVNPAAQHDLLAEQGLGDLTAVVATHRIDPVGKSRDGTVSPGHWQHGPPRAHCRGCGASRPTCSRCWRASWPRRRSWWMRPSSSSCPWPRPDPCHQPSFCPCRGNP